MHTNPDDLLFKEEVFQIVGCAIEVLNTLGHGILENLMKMLWSLNLDYGKFLCDSNQRSTFCIKGTTSGCLFRT
jgi:hypothetical protein